MVMTPTIFSEDQVRVLLMLHDPGDNFHTKPDQQHPQRGIKDEINKVAKEKKAGEENSGFSRVLIKKKSFSSMGIHKKHTEI